MKRYYVTFLGNDTFRTAHFVEAKHIMDAVVAAQRMLLDVCNHTIEIVRIAGVEEEALAREDRFGPALG